MCRLLGNSSVNLVWRVMPFHGGVRHRKCLDGRFAWTARLFLLPPRSGEDRVGVFSATRLLCAPTRPGLGCNSSSNSGVIRSGSRCAHSHRLLAERGVGATSASGVIPFRNLKRSLPVERTRVVFS